MLNLMLTAEPSNSTNQALSNPIRGKEKRSNADDPGNPTSNTHKAQLVAEGMNDRKRLEADLEEPARLSGSRKRPI